MEDMDALFQKMNSFENEIKNTTDRSCVIVAAAYVDDTLTLLLESFLTEGSKTENSDIFENNGTLSTFSSKIKLSYRLGLISQYEYRQIEKVRKIRNLFAHQVLINSLDDNKVRGMVFEMTPERKLLPPKHIPMLKTDKGIDILPYTGLKEEVVDLKINSEYAGAVVDEELPQIPDIDMQSCRDRFEKTIACIIHNLTSRLYNAMIERRRVPKDYDSVLDAAKSRIKDIGYKPIFDSFEENKTLQQKVDDMIIEVRERIKSTQDGTSNKKKEEDLLEELLKTKAKLEQHNQEIERTFFMIAAQKFSIMQIEKALKKENLI